MNKNNSYIMTIILFPFILLLSVLRLINFLKNSFYDYIIYIMLFVFFISFIISLFYIIDDMKNKNESILKWVLLFVFPIFYIVIYYIKNISKEEKGLGFIIFTMDMLLIVLFIFSMSNYIYNYVINLDKYKIVLKSDLVYSDRDNVFSINVNMNYTCRHDLGDYSLSCENKDDDSFIGVYSYHKNYISEGELSDIFDYHMEQTMDYIKEKNYDYTYEEKDNIIVFYYENMEIYMTQINYFNDNDYYSLIVMKELPNSENNLNNYLDLINSIYFLK